MNKRLISICLLVLFGVEVFAMQLFVKLEDNSTITLEVEASDLISEIKIKIQDLTGIETSRQTLTFNSVVLEDNRTLSDYNIHKEDTLILTTTPEVPLNYWGIIVLAGLILISVSRYRRLYVLS